MAATDKDVDQQIGALASKANYNQLKKLYTNKLMKDDGDWMAQMMGQTSLNQMKVADRKILMTMFLIDDWGEFAEIALPLVQKYGPQLWSWVKSKWQNFHGTPGPRQLTSSIVDNTMNMTLPAPQTAALQSSNSQAFQTATYKPVSSAMQPFTLYQASEYDYDSCNKKALQAWLLPQQYQERRPLHTAVKTAQFNYTTEYNVVTDSSGNVGVYIIPYNALVSNVSTLPGNMYFSYVTSTSGSFTPSTGICTSVVPNSGPINPSFNSMTNWLLDYCRVKTIPTVATLQNAGQQELIYWQAPPAGAGFQTAGLALAIPQTTLPQNPFYQWGNMNSSLEGIRLPTDGNDDNFDPIANPPTPILGDGSQSTTEGFYLLITGATPNTQVLKLSVTIQGQFIPVPTAAGLSVMSLPRPGIATIQTISNLLLRFPALQHLTSKQAQQICDSLENCPSSHFKDVINAVSSAFSTLEFKEMSPGGSYQQPSISGVSSIGLIE